MGVRGGKAQYQARRRPAPRCPPMLDVQEVATHLGVPVDPRMVAATQAATGWVETRRCLTPPAVLWADPQVRLGATLYAAHLYQVRAAPSGTDLYGDPGPDVSVLPRARELVGMDPVIA